MKADHKLVKSQLTLAKGQLEGILRMVEDDRYCIDISTQILAVQAILKKTNKFILEAHLDACVKNTLTQEGQEKLQEIFKIMEKLQE